MKLLSYALAVMLFTSFSIPQNKCGGKERWDVKTVTDDGTVHLTTHKSESVADMVQEPRPDIGMHTPRQPFEENVITIKAKIVFYKHEANDRDIHAVLSDGIHTMIVEFPDCSCPTMAKSRVIDKATQAKADFLNLMEGQPMNQFFDGVPVKITGVAFFDFLHHQTGVAPNGIELHPVLSISPAE